jgi:hypothetical protein
MFLSFPMAPLWRQAFNIGALGGLLKMQTRANLKRQFSKHRPITQHVYERCSTELLIKPSWAITPHFLRWLLWKRQEVTSAGEDVEKRQHLPVGMKTGRAIIENSMKVSKKFKSRTSIGYSNPTSGCTANGNEISIAQRCLHFRVSCSTIQNTQEMETA